MILSWALWGLAALGGPELPAAERAYREGRFEAAHRLYLVALERAAPGRRGAILHDLALCALALDRPAEARWRLLCARLLRPRDGRVLAALGRVEAMLGVPPEPGRWRSWAAPGEWALAGALLQALGLVIWLAGRRRVRRVPAAALVVAGLGAIVLAGLESARPPRGVVLDEPAVLRSRPQREARSVAELGRGRTVSWLAASDRWVWVRAGGVEGYVERGRVRPIRGSADVAAVSAGE